MKFRTVSHAEFCRAARLASGDKQPAPLHLDALTEAAFILAATLVFVTIVDLALRIAGIA